MLQSNQPIQRVDNNRSVWEAAGIGAGLAGVKIAAMDIPLGIVLNKDVSKMNPGKMRNAVQKTQDVFEEVLGVPRTITKDSHFLEKANYHMYMNKSLKAKGIKYGAALALGGITGALLFDKE